MLKVFIAFLLLGAPAHALTLPVLSGEHRSFTRLVVDLPPDTSWRLGRIEGGYGLRVELPDLMLDASRVFQRIPRSRLADLRQDQPGGLLRLSLNCQCHAVLTPGRPGLVIIDLRDGPAPPGAVTELALESTGPRLPVPMRRSADPTFLSVPLAPPDELAAALRVGLMEDMSRSIAAGALRAVAALPEKPVIPPALPGPVLLPFPEEAPDQIRFHNADPAGQGNPPATETRCVAPARLNIADWAETAEAGRAIADTRRHLTSVADHPEAQALSDAIRTHLHFGLGAEARALLALGDLLENAPQALADRAVWLAISHIVDSEADGGFFSGMQGCEGPASLWATLSDPAAPPPHDLNTPFFLSAFAELPPALRQALGPALASRFLAAGHQETAIALRNSIARASAAVSAPLLLLEGEIARTESSPDHAAENFEKVIRSDAGLAPLALAALAETRFSEDASPDPELVLALEAMARDHPAGEAGQALARALAKGRLLSGNHLAAWRDAPPEDKSLHLDLWRMLLQRGSDTALTDIALRTANEIPEIVPPALRLGIGRRLAELGFVRHARDWLNPLTLDGTDIALAIADLSDRDGRAALRRLAGRQDPEAAKLRAAALELLADSPAAAQAWAEAGDPQRAARATFLAGTQEQGNPWAPPPLDALVSDLTATANDAPETPLASARARLTASSASRDRIGLWLSSQGDLP